MVDWNKVEYQSLHSRMFSYIIKCIYNRYGQNYYITAAQISPQKNFSEPNGDILFYNNFLMGNESTQRIIHSSHNFIDWYLRTNDVDPLNAKIKKYTILANFQNYYPNSEHYKNFCGNIETIIGRIQTQQRY